MKNTFVIRRALGAGLAALLAGGACGSGDPEPGSRGPGSGEPSVKAVVTVRPVREPLEDTFLEREATLLPVAEATISTRQDGFVRKMIPEVGDVVHAGDVIAELDRTDGRLRLAELQAGLDKARTSLGVERRGWERVVELHAAHVASDEQREEQKAKLDRARARVAEVHARLSREQEWFADLTLRAHMPGIVARLHAETGEYVKRGDPIVDLKRTDTIVALCTVGERFLSQVREGSPARVRVNAYPEREFEGLVWKIVGDALVESRSFPVKILLSNPSLELAPGMSARVAFTRHVDDALLVPKDAIVREGTEDVVYVVNDGNAERRTVELGAALGDRRHVRRGLGADEQIVVTGNEDLHAGDEVKVVELPPPGPPTLPDPAQAEHSRAAGS